MLQTMLFKAGFTSLEWADNGMVCVSTPDKEEHPDVVIIDEMQCYLAGLDIIEKMHYTWPDSKFIILTGINSDLDVNQLSDNGSMYFMDKKNITADNLPQLLYTIVTKKISSTKVPKTNKVYSSLRRSFTGMLNSILF
jgi:DNA-binding NtrC family response regulator